MKWLLPIVMLALTASAPARPRSGVRSIDFRNFTFPGIWEKQITLKGGKAIVAEKHCEANYSLDDVVYRDLNDDGHEDAVVSVEDLEACGSSCLSYSFYVYTLKNNRPVVLWKWSTGCEGNGGLKDFHLSGKFMVFELFGRMRIAGTKTDSGGDNSGGDCCPVAYTRLWIAWDGRAFRQRRLRFLPFRYPSISDYWAHRTRE